MISRRKPNTSNKSNRSQSLIRGKAEKWDPGLGMVAGGTPGSQNA